MKTLLFYNTHHCLLDSLVVEILRCRRSLAFVAGIQKRKITLNRPNSNDKKNKKYITHS